MVSSELPVKSSRRLAIMISGVFLVVSISLLILAASQSPLQSGAEIEFWGASVTSEKHIAFLNFISKFSRSY
jgi:uncharacterized membrane protein (DUF485 family)